MLDLCLADRRILYFWYVLKYIHKFIIEPHVLQCLFVKESNKKQRRGRIISNFTKFFISYDSQVLLRVTSQCGHPSCTLRKRSSSPLQFDQEKNIPGHSIESRAYRFILKIARMFRILTSRNKIKNTLPHM